MLGHQFLNGNFYKEKSSFIDKLITDYYNKRSSPLKTTTEDILSREMETCGYRLPGESCISIEKEFSRSDGSLDHKKIRTFRNLIIRHYALQEIRWGFAGTTYRLSPVTRLTLEENGESLNNLLPLELKNPPPAYLASRKKNRAELYLYPDGLITSDYIKGKGKIGFNLLKKGGSFNWTADNYPNPPLKNNNEGNKVEWEIHTPRRMNSFNAMPGKTVLHRENSIVLIKPAKADECFLLDPQSTLVLSHTKEYYSISGDLYTVHRTNRKRSPGQIRKELRKRGIKKIKWMVIRNNNPDLAALYKKHLKPFIKEDTQFYTRDYHLLSRRLQKTIERTREEKISDHIQNLLAHLISRGRRGKELLDALAPVELKNKYYARYNIPGNNEDMKKFLTFPGVNEVLDNKTLEWLGKQEIPESATLPFSFALGNIFLNYSHLFSYMPPFDILKSIYDVIVKKKSKYEKTLPVSGEIPFMNLVKENREYDTRTTVPFFRGITLCREEYHNIFTERGFENWEKEVLKKTAPEYISSLRSRLQEVMLQDKKKFSMTLQNLFFCYTEIHESTGMTPPELFTCVSEVVEHNHSHLAAAAGKVRFKTNLYEVIKEAARGSRLGFYISKTEDFPFEKTKKKNSLNLFKTTDFNRFILQKGFISSGIGQRKLKKLLTRYKEVKKHHPHPCVEFLDLTMDHMEKPPSSPQEDKGDPITIPGWRIEKINGKIQSFTFSSFAWRTLEESERQRIKASYFRNKGKKEDHPGEEKKLYDQLSFDIELDMHQNEGIDLAYDTTPKLLKELLARQGGENSGGASLQQRFQNSSGGKR